MILNILAEHHDETTVMSSSLTAKVTQFSNYGAWHENNTLNSIFAMYYTLT